MTISLIKNTLLGFGLMISLLSCKHPRGIVEKIHDTDDIKIFFGGYEKAISTGNHKLVAEFYSDRGAVIISQGHMMNLSLDSIQSLYLKNPMPESDFRFNNLKVELLGDSSAMVNAIIYMHLKEQKDTSRMMYTAVLLRTKNGWKIRHEHESPDSSIYPVR